MSDLFPLWFKIGLAAFYLGFLGVTLAFCKWWNCGKPDIFLALLAINGSALTTMTIAWYAFAYE